jgi:hypothetical protein
VDGKQRMVSAKTRSWALAEEAKRALETRFRTVGVPLGDVAFEGEARVTIERAVDLFLKDKQAQGLGDAVLGKYGRELGRLSRFL